MGLLDGLGRTGGSEPLCLIFHEPREPGADMWLGHVDVILFSDSRRAVPHQFGERVPVHSALGASCAEGMAPAIKRKPLQARFPDRPEMRFLNANHVP
jgi:hypothetical protein